MDMGELRGLVTAALLILFLALVFWAWSRKRKDTFDRAARMPLEDDPPASEYKEREQQQ